MSTPLSGLSPYCSPAQLILLKDARTVIGDWCSDNDTRIPQGSWATNPTMLLLLQQASGMVESAVAVGAMYKVPDDLVALTGNSATMLAGLVADLFTFLAWSRRPNRGTDLPIEAKLAFEMLDKLRDGHAVLGILENMNAGTPSLSADTPEIIEERRGAVTIARRLWGRRGNQYPQNTD